jgi:hypothetical protein
VARKPGAGLWGVELSVGTWSNPSKYGYVRYQHKYKNIKSDTIMFKGGIYSFSNARATKPHTTSILQNVYQVSGLGNFYPIA